MMFRDRTSAGRHLARLLVKRLPTLADEDPIVLAVSRGGVIVGREIAAALGAPLDVFVTRRICAPGYESIGIGAVAPDGSRLVDGTVVRMLGVSDAYLDEVTAAELAELDLEMRRYRGDRALPRLADRSIVIADDGVSTRFRARTAVSALRREGPRRLVFAVPVCASDARDAIAQAADEIVYGAVPERFCGAAAWYDDFAEPTDAEIASHLERAARAQGARPLPDPSLPRPADDVATRP